MSRRIDWNVVVKRAAEIVVSYETGVTLRQLFYRLVSEAAIPNTDVSYKTLSARTAQARRDGWFPALIDRGRAIHRPASWSSPANAMAALLEQPLKLSELRVGHYDWLRERLRGLPPHEVSEVLA